MTAARLHVALALLAWLIVHALPAAGQDTLARAKDLYGSAAYEEALGMLDRLQPESKGETALEVALYRVFCLLVLERSDEATDVIESMVRADPFYMPSDEQASPRIRSVFKEVRRARLPGLVQQLYAEAKAAFERKEPGAAAQFDHVIALLDDPEMKGGALADLKTVASGFRDLSQAAVAKPAANPPPASKPAAISPAPAAPSPGGSDASTARAKMPEAVDTVPVPISQPLPPWSPAGRDAQQIFAGVIEVVIDERGTVTAAQLLEGVHPAYDAAVVKLALTWKYKPAMKNGAPTGFVMPVRIRLQPPS